jgi:hypothetical protein
MHQEHDGCYKLPSLDPRDLQLLSRSGKGVENVSDMDMGQRER